MLLFFLLSIILRIIFALPTLINPEKTFSSITDSMEYREFAEKIINRENIPDKIHLLRTPGYPFFLALFNLNGRIIIIMQILLTSIIVLLVQKFHFMNKKRKIIFSLLYCFNFNIALHTAQFFSDTLFMFIIFLGIMATLSYIKEQNIYKAILISLLFSISTIIRPIGIYFLPIITIFLLIKTKKLAKIIFILLFYFLFLSPWYIMNYIKFNRIFFCKISANSLIYYEAPVLLSVKEGISLDSARTKLFNEAEEMKTSDNEVDYLTACYKVGMKYLLKYPLVYLKIRLLGLLTTIFLPIQPQNTLIYFTGNSPGLKEVSQKALSLISHGKIILSISLIIKERFLNFPIYLILLFIFATIYHLFVIIYAFIGVKNKEIDIWSKILFLITIFYFAFLPGVVGGSRFRIPIEPFILIFSSLKF